MSTKKYSFSTFIIYAIAFYSPGLATQLSHQVTLTTITYALGALILVALYLKQNSPISLEKKQISWMICLILGIMGIFGAIFLQSIVLQIEQFFGQDIASENTAGAIALTLQQPMFAIAIMVGGPIMEEFVFRRALIGLLESFMNVWVAISISSFLFALIHFDGHLLLYFSLGFFFSLLYKFTGRIWTSILIHVGMNSLVVIVQVLSQ